MIQQLNQVRWAMARLFFIVYIGFSVVSLVGGFLTAPLMTWYFFGDWRFWRHWSAGLGLLPHGVRLLRLMASEGQSFMFSVPLTSPPRTSPDLSATTLHPLWPQGESCGDCSNCCKAGGNVCPLLNEADGLCRGYNSFYWRYFNCGRFPSVTSEIEYYGCSKWVLVPTGATRVPPGTVSPVLHFDDLATPRQAIAVKDLLQNLRQMQSDPSETTALDTSLETQAVPPPVRKPSAAWSPTKSA